MTVQQLCSEAAIMEPLEPQRPRRDRVAATVRYRRYEVLALLRLAQKRWRMPAVRVAQLFSEAGVYDYVTELYDLLFDFSSRQWAEGPDNLRFVWEQEKKNG